ncbi:hypothetical protein PSP20601_04836 [Pandoraea sputorum]|uniref:Outer membrane protein W n=2 Tax=Pandoraea sputorum TaxID=93222 RepID=A0A239STK1_9BURK|nr:hypothetical protein NA29_24650 [Pandoraea sputorum]SNU88168.1 Uncharacterised protein [Pandoraea sputorum]VVE53433.1 hypothetical protein PSP20601_04836 [Pandoraea sputorum]VVE83502.1 hypothetical protein PSP31120_04147 [Pandoraea sputorum]
MNCKAMAFAVAMLACISHAQAIEVYGAVGTEGLGVGAGVGVTNHLGVRADVNGLALSHSFTAGQVRYDGKARFVHGGVYADFFPAPATLPFRLTAGMLVGNDHVDLVGHAVQSTYVYRGVAYSTAGQSVNGRIKLPTVRPYVGIGFGHSPLATPGWSMSFDAGVAYGKPTVELDVPPLITAIVGQATVDDQRQQLQDKADKLKFYPIVKVGVTYKW